MTTAWWTFRIFFIFFFCSGEGEGGVEAKGGGGADFLLKISGGGSPGGRGAEGRGGCLGEMGNLGGGGGSKYFFSRGRNVHQDCLGTITSSWITRTFHFFKVNSEKYTYAYTA